MVAGSAQSSKYVYDLTLIDHEEFDRFHTFVKSIFDQGRQRFDINLATITNWVGMAPKEHWEYLLTSDSLAVSMTVKGKPEEFHIWVTPSYKQPVFKFYMTLAHELVHGYAGMKYGHNSYWRRWFYRTLWHLVEAGFIPKPEDELKYVCATVENAYNQTPKLDPMLTILEAFSKAEFEHKQVNDNYFKRLENCRKF